MKVVKPLSICVAALASVLFLATCTTGRLFLENNLPVDLGQGQSNPARTYISTKRSDTYPAVSFIDLAYDVKHEKPRSVDSLPADKNGVRIAKPGYYYKQARTYCLRPSAEGPASGDADYLAAPLKGSAAPIVKDLILLGENESVSQDEVQETIWAIELGKFDYVLEDSHMAHLLNARDRQWLRTRAAEKKALASANSVVQDNLPSGVQGALGAPQTFADAFDSFASGDISFDQLAKLAVPKAKPSQKSGATRSAQWALLPAGYYVRAVPDDYSSTRLEYYVPRRVKWVYDRLGRPRSATDETTGFRIDYGYWGETVYVTVPGYPFLKAYPFKSVKVTVPASISKVGKVVTFIWKDRGFIIAGPLKPLLEHHAQNGEAVPEPLGMGPQLLLAQESGSDSVGSVVAKKGAKTGIDDASKALKEGIPNEDRELLGEVGGYVIDAMEIYDAAAAASDLPDPNMSQVDRVRATEEVANAIPTVAGLAGEMEALQGAQAAAPFAVPLAVAEIMINQVTGIWNECSNALAGVSPGKKGGVKTVGGVVVLTPRHGNKQSLGAAPKLKQYQAP